ncbi:NAD(+) diphosphatase [Methanoregula sp.]|uniref:NAD(+) diphosphatase n=1 Tax=Methanoregula sp. TaxID=2052170 RepID=UPI002CBA82E2|nr:NAD(+) diphosphatase [Methanoregula sp.]HVP95942.1 NAD(+) diphosphatase [Methanoregula sp.]
MKQSSPPLGTLHHAVFAISTLTSRFPVPGDIPEGALFVVTAGQGIVVHTGDTPQIYWQADDLPASCTAGPAEYLGHRDRVPVYAVEIGKSAVLPGSRVETTVRELYGRVPDEDLAIASYAVRMIHSAAASRFCGRCGHSTEPVPAERAWRCPDCGLVVYPRISPAVIVLISQKEKILLARSPRFPAGMHSVIAGFAEPGETLEHAVCREVKEEVGISVKNIRYFASEPWPFPDSLMIAFTAEYDSGEITIDNNEIISAGWFGRDNLPALPAPLSISRALIDRWIQKEGTGQ